MDGILYMTAGSQITDDIADTNIDLRNGFETLVNPVIDLKARDE